MEPNRPFQPPIIEILSNLITPTVRYSANAYDLADRRWYRLDVKDARVPPDEWLADTVAFYINAHWAEHGQCPGWNVIRLGSNDARDRGLNQEVEFVLLEKGVDRPITEWLDYGDGERGRLRTVGVEELKDLRYISRSADQCVWNGKDCVFKRIEFDCDVDVIQQEIEVREKLVDMMGFRVDGGVEGEMMSRFAVVPILAVVIASRGPWKQGSVAGVLMAFCGSDLEILARNGSVLPITVSQLRELVCGVRELGRCGVEHGDIKYWNTVLRPGPDECGASLVLIDVGSVSRWRQIMMGT